MKKFPLILIFFTVFSCSFFKSESDHEIEMQQKGNSMQFVEGSQDIPLASGLIKISDDENLGFDSTGGSILSVSYKNDINSNDTKDFYLKTLPQMGWKIAKIDGFSSIDTLCFVRDQEKLEIEFSAENQMSLVKFFVESSSK